MSKSQEEFYKELLADFMLEAGEHHLAIINGLIGMEKANDDEVLQKYIEVTFRELHSLKGASRAVNLTEIERLSQSMENVLHKAKNGELTISSKVYDTFHKGLDLIGILLNDIAQGKKSMMHPQVQQFVKDLEAALKEPLHTSLQETGISETEGLEETLPSIPEPNKPEIPQLSKLPQKDTLRISVDKLNLFLRQAEEFIAVKATMGHFSGQVHEVRKDVSVWRKQWELFTNKETEERFSDPHELNTFIRWQTDHLKKIELDIRMIQKEMEQHSRYFSRMVDDMLIDIKSTLSVPFMSLLDQLPKMTRDLAREFGKEINVTISGGEIEIDKRILEEIKDPLIHIVRNCIDHGIELPEIRKGRQKDVAGKLGIEVTKTTNRKVRIEIVDDGYGIQQEKLKLSAIKHGIISQEEAGKLSSDEINMLVFRSGLSTSAMITDMSGRGLGLAIVAEKVSKLGGDLSVSSEEGKGTKFTILLPLTLATFRGVLVKVNNQMLVIPTNTVSKATRININEIVTVEGQEAIRYKEQTISLVRLSTVLGIEEEAGRKKTAEAFFPVLILSHAMTEIAFRVDDVLGEQDGMVKDLGTQLVKIRNIAGATVLGSGKIIPIIDVAELFESAIHTKSEKTFIQENDLDLKNNTNLRILVAEDSITARSLIRNILESAGFVVKTAVDGMEAYAFLKNETFDLVVSDVEMPRMNGFELTSRIRSDKRTEEVPVILITALESPEDRQRGLDAGASAYIVKSSFEQSNLLDTIQRLI
jgi:two-component system chemotaxis sensor kinase CheA